MNDLRTFIEAVRECTNLARLIGDDIALRPSGSVLKGSSPHHRDSNPSFVVWPHTQTWRDFSGGGSVGGDCFDYIMHRDGLGFMDALAHLAHRCGLTMPTSSGRFQDALIAHQARRQLEQLLTESARYFHAALPAAVRAAWLEERYAFTQATIDDLWLGWADGGLLDHLCGTCGTTEDEALSTGLFVRLEGGRVVEFFQNRLVFPYWRRGRVAYFIARKTELTPDRPWEDAKYKKLLTHSKRHPYVSPELQNDTFYNEDAARSAPDRLLVTEGVTDCISALQAGIPCISPVTVRFRKRDLPKLLELTRRTPELVICNDAEDNGAGEAGALETARALIAEGRSVRIATLPRAPGAEKTDLNGFLREHGSEALPTVLDEALPLTAYLIEQVPEDTPAYELAARLEPIVLAMAHTDPVARDAYEKMLRKRFNLRTSTLRELIAKTITDDSKREVPKARHLKGSVYEAADHYYAVDKSRRLIPVSTFRLTPKRRIVTHDDDIVEADAVTTSGIRYRDLRFPRQAWLSKRSLLKSLKPIEMLFTGSDENAQGILSCLLDYDIPSVQGSRLLGYNETSEGPVWLTSSGQISPTQTTPLVYVSSGNALEPRVREIPASSPPEIRKLAQTVLPKLLELNAPEVMLPIIGWFFAAPLRPRLQAALSHFPTLCVWGVQGSGKSTLIMDVLWPLFGLSSTEPFSATETTFSLLTLLSSTASVPVFIDEYKPYDMPPRRLKSLHRFLRRLYTCESESRGRADLSVVTFQLRAPLCLAGETRPIESALVERIITANPSKDRLLRHPEHRDALRTLKSLDLGKLAHSLILHLLGRDTTKDLAFARQIVDIALEGREVPLRMRDNLTAVVCGLVHYEGYAKHFGIALPELDVHGMIRAQLDDLLEGSGTAVKTGLDYFLDSPPSLAVSGEIHHGRQYYTVSADILALHIPSCHAAYAEHCRRAGYEGEVVDKKALKRQLQENKRQGGYVRELNKTTSFGSKYNKRRATHIHMKRAKALLEVDDFPCEDTHKWPRI